MNHIIFIIGAAIASGGRGSDPACIAMGVLFVTVVAAFGYRLSRLAVITNSDQIVVRNYYWSHRIRREQIRAFGRGRPTMGNLVETITIVTDSATIVL